MADKKIYDASDPGDVQARKKTTETVQAMQLEGLRAMMGTVQGRAFMWWLLTITHPFQTSCVEFNARVYFAEGERNIGLQILNLLRKKFPDEYIRMEKENTVNQGD